MSIRRTALVAGLSMSACTPSIDAVCHRVRSEGLFPQEHLGRRLTARETQGLYMRALRSSAAREHARPALDFERLESRSNRAFESAYGDGSRSFLVAGLPGIGKVCGGVRRWGDCRCFSAADSTADLLAWVRYFD